MLKRRPGITRVQVLIVVVMLFVVIGLVISGVQKQRDAAERTQINNNLKQCALGVHAYHDVYKHFPSASGESVIFGPKRVYSWSILLVPYVEARMDNPIVKEEDGLPVTSDAIPPYQALLDFTTNDWVRVQNFACNLRVFTDSGVDAKFNTNLNGIKWTANTHYHCDTTLGKTFTDGTSVTIMLATRYGFAVEVGKNGTSSDPSHCISMYDVTCGGSSPTGAYFGYTIATGTPHAEDISGGWMRMPTLDQAAASNSFAKCTAMSFTAAGLQVALCDASVRMITPTFSAHAWNTALQPNDGNKPGSDW